MRSRLTTLTMLATAGLSAGALSVAALGAASRPAIVLGKPTELAITAPASVKAGTVSFAVRNGGKAKHEIEIIRTAKRAASLPVKGGKAVAPDELKEIENIRAGRHTHAGREAHPGSLHPDLQPPGALPGRHASGPERHLSHSDCSRRRRDGVASDRYSGSCQTSPRMIGTAAPLEVIPSTSTSGPPIMKSVWTSETLMPAARRASTSRSRPPVTVCG